MSSKTVKACLVTGAAGGIGRALARTFSDAGYHVIATDIVESPGGIACASYIPGDLVKFVRDEHYAEGMVQKVRAALSGKHLRVLINNAAVQILGGVDHLGRSDWQSTLDVNLLAPFLLTQALLPDLEATNGSSASVINIGSIHARLTKKGFVAYATSKAALAGMTRAMAIDLGPRIRVNAIEPAAIETEMLKAGFVDKPDQYAGLSRIHPQQRIGEPEEVAFFALAIADGGMRFLHGACIGIDGGLASRLFDPE